MAVTGSITVQCVDNPEGCPGVIVYGDETFPIPVQQHAQDGSGGGQGLCSSVRVFQLPWENEDTAMECDPPESAKASNVAPGTYADVPMELD